MVPRTHNKPKITTTFSLGYHFFWIIKAPKTVAKKSSTERPKRCGRAISFYILKKLKIKTYLIDSMLYDYQIEHVSKIEKVLSENNFCLDFSILGSGKTYTSLTIAKNYPFVLVIAPKSVHDKWKKVAEEIGVELVDVLTFAGLRKKAKNEYLEIKVSGTSEIIRKTDYFKTIKGGIIIIDEIQNLKNNTLQFRAARELLKGKFNKFLGLSGSPIDKTEQASRVFGLCDMYRSQLASYNIGTRSFDYSGLEEIRHFLKDNTPFSPGNYKGYCYNMFQTKFKKFVFEMECPQFPTFVDTKNGLYSFGANTEIAKIWVDNLNSLLVYKQKNGHSIELMSQISSVLMNLEKTKISTFIRLAKKQLSENPNKKVVLLFNYIDSIHVAQKELATYNPSIIYGKTSQKERANILGKFQAGNTESRLLIGNLEVLSTGIDLDDKFGTFPRVCYCNANFNAITLYQLVHRFKRIDTKSNATIRFVYCKDAELETKIINALTRKTKVMKETTEMQARHNVIFPGDLAFDMEICSIEDSKRISLSDSCGICLELFEDAGFQIGESEPVILKCDHVFHENCVSEWFISSGAQKCPYCRTEHE